MDGRLSGVGVVDKAVALLAAVESGARTLNELVEVTGLPRPTVHRLAGALVAHGLVRRDEELRYLPGLRLIALGRAASQSLPLARVAQRPLEDLRDATGESAQLYVREGEGRVCVAVAESPHGLRTIVPLGAVLALRRGSAGAVLRLASCFTVASSCANRCCSVVTSVCSASPSARVSVSAGVQAARQRVAAAASRVPVARCKVRPKVWFSEARAEGAE